MNTNSRNDKNCIVYCRRAYVHKDTNNPFQEQENDCQALATALGYEVAVVIKEFGSGLVCERIGIDQLLRLCADKLNDVRAIITKDPMRLARRNDCLQRLISTFKTLNIEVKFVEPVV